MDNQPNTDPKQMPFVPQISLRTPPQHVAMVIGDHVKAGLIIIGWFILAAFGLGVAYICIRGIVWAAKLFQQSLGV